MTRSFRTGQSVTTSLDSVTFTVNRGEFVAILGPSGAGKSTLLNLLGLLDTPTEGAYYLDGVEVSKLGERQRDRIRNEKIGFIFQESHALLDETAAENVGLPLKIRGTRIAVRSHAARSELGRFELAHRAGELAINLSGGERQRVAVARAVSTDPMLILADEPTGALDSMNSLRVMDHLVELNANGTTVMIITHDRAVAARAARQIELVDGVIVSDTGFAATGSSTVSDPPREREHAGHSAGTVPGRFWPRIASEIFDAISTQSGNLGRTVLLLVAFTLGVGGLVCAIGVSQSAAAQVSDRLTHAGLDEVVVRARGPIIDLHNYDPASGNSGSHAVTRLDGVAGAGYIASISGTDARPRLIRDGLPPAFDGDVAVATSTYLKIQGATTTPSHIAPLLDNNWSGAVAILGHRAAQALGITDAAPGVRIWIADNPVDIVGFIADAGRDELLNNSILLSTSAATGLAAQDTRLVIRTDPGMPAAIAEAVPLAIAPANPSTVQVETVADLRQLRHGVSSDLGMLIGLVAVLLLVLACLTSAVAMYLSVRARASEIALRRAVGASRSSIWRLFSIEGLVVGLGGGIAGAAFGLLSVVAICAVQGWTPVLSPLIVAVGVGVGAISGILSTLYPAIVAAKSNPALAIRA
jgi:macrolide transport system ATP-binding/permease protein